MLPSHRAQVGLLVRRELRRAVTSRWFVAYAGVLLAGGILFTVLGFGDAAVARYRGFVRGVAGIAQLALFFVPVMAMLPVITTLANDQDNGTLEYLVAQPVSFSSVYAGAWLGGSAGIGLSILVGMGGTGAFASLRGVPLSVSLALVGFVVAVALAFSGLGALLFVLAQSRTRATTVGLIVWLGLLVFGTLGILTAFVRWGLSESVLVAWSFVNPVEAFRIGVLALLDPDLSLLGPIGASIIRRLGPDGTALAASLTLVVWATVPGAAGWWLANRRRAPA